MKIVALSILLLTSTLHAATYSDLEGTWVRVGVRCAGSADIYPVRDWIIDLRPDSFTHVSHNPTYRADLATEGRVSVLREAGAKVTIRISELLFRTLKISNGELADFFSRDEFEGKILTLASESYQGQTALIVDGFNRKHIGGDCRTSTQYIYLPARSN